MKRLSRFITFTFFCLFFLACQPKDQSAHNEQNQDTIESEVLIEPEIKPNTRSEVYQKKQVPVLCYHRIEEGRNDEYTVTPATFKKHMQALVDSAYQSISPEQYYNYLVYNEELPEKPIIISFDDARKEQATIAAPIMEELGLRGTFFIMTITYNKKNYMSTDQIVALAEGGHTIGFHTWDHTKATKFGNDSILRQNLIEPKQKLETIIGQSVDYFAYPYGLTDARTNEQMEDHFKMSFILSTAQDSIHPLQSVRRMIACEWSPQGLIIAMERTFSRR